MSSELKKPEITKAVLEAIKSRHIRPTPRWIVLLKRALFWAFVGVFSILGILAVAFFLSDLSLSQIGSNALGLRGRVYYLLASMPIVWLSGILIFALLAFWNFRSTSRGYRHPALKVLLVSIAISFLGGALLDMTGISRRIQALLADPLSGIRAFQTQMQARWMNPNAGLLMGRISSDLPEDPEKQDLLTLEDGNGKIWMVFIKGAEWRGFPRIREEKKIRIIGVQISESEFRAEHILPWPGRGMGMGGRPGQGMGPGMGPGMGRGRGLHQGMGSGFGP